MDQFQRNQTRAGWMLCLGTSALATLFSLLRAPNVWVVVLIICIAHVLFYHLYVTRPSQKSLEQTRDFLLMINNRALSAAMVLLTYTVPFVGLASTKMAVTFAHATGFVLLVVVCSALGGRQAATQWRTRADLELAARSSTSMGMAIRSKYTFFFFATVAVVSAAVFRYLGDNVVPAMLAVLCSAAASYMLGHMITKQAILLRLLPKDEEARA